MLRQSPPESLFRLLGEFPVPSGLAGGGQSASSALRSQFGCVTVLFEPTHAAIPRNLL